MPAPHRTLASRFQKFLGLETKASLAAPDAWLTELFGAPPNNSGIAVTPQVAMTCAPVNCAVRTISEALAQLPVHVYLRGPDDAKERAPGHPAYTLLHDASNDWTPAYEFKRQITADALLHHGGFAEIIRVDGGKPYELIRLRPETVLVVPDMYTGEPAYTAIEAGGNRAIAREDILHIRAPFLNSYRDESLIRLAADSIGLALLLERHATRLMANGAKPSGLISLKGITTPDGITKAKAAWQATHGGSNGGGTAVIPADASWQSLTFTSVDSQFMEMRKFAINEIARVFRVPPHMLYALERVTHTNGEQLGQEFITYCLMSWVKRFEGEIQLKLFTPEERKTFFAEFLTDDFARADLAARTEAQVKQIAARIINPNEARAQNNLPPYVGGEKFENPNTTTAVLSA